MGGWKLEVAKMALYITFPVGLFHYFNQPEFFEHWVVQTKREMYPRDDSPEKLEFAKAIQRLKEQHEQERIKALDG